MPFWKKKHDSRSDAVTDLYQKDNSAKMMRYMMTTAMKYGGEYNHQQSNHTCVNNYKKTKKKVTRAAVPPSKEQYNPKHTPHSNV
jgi:hypothetical protein